MLQVIYAFLVCILLVVYVWCLYNLPILVAGIRTVRSSGDGAGKKRLSLKKAPVVSIIVPVKNEEKVIDRLLHALSRLRYPADKKEIIIVEDGSADKTVDICIEYAKKSGINVKILRKPFSNGKPSALNYAVKHATGDIIGIFDADSVPDHDVLLNMCKYFEFSDVAAVQGRTMSINSEENMLTKFLSYEEAVWCEAYLKGKDVLNLFVHLKGSCQFVRRSVLEKVRGFDEGSLSEDMEFSARLTQKKHTIRYASDVRSWQESPSDLKQLLRQRTRWYRGTFEVAFKYGKLMAKLSKKSMDAELTLFGPFILIASLTAYLSGVFSFFAAFPFDFLFQLLMQFSALVTTLTLFICGLALMYTSKPWKISNVLWLPFIFFYLSLQAFIALYAALLILFRRPRRWIKTDKTGITKTKDFELEAAT